MNSDVTLIARLKDEADTLSKNQRVLAKYISANYQTVAFSTITELAGLSGVSEATIVRFAKALGFSGYPAFQREVRRLVRADLKVNADALVSQELPLRKALHRLQLFL